MTSEPKPAAETPVKPADASAKKNMPQKEFGGPKGPEPTRFGDWEIAGRCSDF